MSLSYKFFRNNTRPFNIVFSGQDLQGDAEFIVAITIFYRAVRFEYYVANFFNHGKNSKLKFYWKLFK